MSAYTEQAQRTYSTARSNPLLDEVAQLSDIPPLAASAPKVVIKGDIRLRVSEAYAALKPIKGSYSIDLKEMRAPLQVIWITEGKVLRHSVQDIDLEFDLRGARAGETRTHLLTAHVTELDGQGSIVQSSVFVRCRVSLSTALSGFPTRPLARVFFLLLTRGDEHAARPREQWRWFSLGHCSIISA